MVNPCVTCLVNKLEIDFERTISGFMKQCKECRKKQCNHVTIPKPLSCDECSKGPPEVEFKWRPETNKWRPTCMSCYNVKNYSGASRDRKHRNDEEAYLLHNAKIAKEWRDNNKQRVTEWRHSNYNYKLNGIKQQAAVKSIPWDKATMTNDHCLSLMATGCHYCKRNDANCVNGIDRMNSHGSYTLENCVSCCKVCNSMKRCLDAHTFVERCCHIAHHNGYPSAPTQENAWPSSTRCSFAAYKERATKKNLEFNLTETEFVMITKSPCRYCKCSNSGKNGIDRIDNTIGYNNENCCSCCSECNYMKSDILVEEFLQTCINVAKRKDEIQIPIDMMRCFRSFSKRT